MVVVLLVSSKHHAAFFKWFFTLRLYKEIPKLFKKFPFSDESRKPVLACQSQCNECRFCRFKSYGAKCASHAWLNFLKANSVQAD
jgi:hypothetical protein